METTSKDPLVLPAIPAKRYFTIGEVSELCGVKPHVLRYWEQEFTQLKPVKRRGNRRYYQHHEVLLVRRIRQNCSTKKVSPSAVRATASMIRISVARVSRAPLTARSILRHCVPGSWISLPCWNEESEWRISDCFCGQVGQTAVTPDILLV
jgi:hypothetical protein